MDHFDSPAFTRAAAHLAELGVNSTSWTNIVVAAEALERGLTVRRSRTQPRMVIEHRGTVKTWAGGSTDHNADLAKRIAAQKDVDHKKLRWPEMMSMEWSATGSLCHAAHVPQCPARGTAHVASGAKGL